ncbi:hypothetical protein M569_02449, partial [Genlisea aurea]
SSYGGLLYDSTAYTECQNQPEEPLYGGGILRNRYPNVQQQQKLSFPIDNLEAGTKYCFSAWVKIRNVDSDLIRATIITEDEGETSLQCVGTVIANEGCWSFLKGGFVSSSSYNSSELYLASSSRRNMSIEIASYSLQPFTEEEWRLNQEAKINQIRKRAVTIHVSDHNGVAIEGASVKVKQVYKDFPFGSAIAESIIGNSRYQKWFVDRFNAAVFENELKWQATEYIQGELNYTIPDLMMEFIRSNQIVARGHNIFWENPNYVPRWVLNLGREALESAVKSRIQSLIGKYRDDFVHWDVNNEMLHFDFYEEKLGRNASVEFFRTANDADPLATLFMNEFNVVETCSDDESTVDTYVARMRELNSGGVRMDGIGLQGHFENPNPPLMRGILDKLATLEHPIWLTEVDVSKKFSSQKQQAIYLEEVLREGFSHPGVDGIMLWSAIRGGGCYQMCLTDGEFNNLPTGDKVDELLREWGTAALEGTADKHGSYSFLGFLGEYRISATVGNTTVKATLSLAAGKDTKHFNI